MTKAEMLKRSQVRLEYQDLLKFLAEYAKSDPGRMRALGLDPAGDLEKVQRDLHLLSEMMSLFNLGLSPPLGFFSDIGPGLETAGIGSILGKKELLEILQFLNQADQNRKFFKSRPEKFTGLAGLAGRIENFSELRARLDRSLDEKGELKNSASPELARLREEFSGLRAQIQKKLDRMLSAKDFEKILQDTFYTEREGRFVIPVKSADQASVSGIVHDTSASGATVFIEPMEMVPLNNRLRILEREMEAEILKILAELTRQVAELKNELLMALDSLTELDLIQAKSHLANRLSASIPQVGSNALVKLYQARHPLLILKGKETIANDLALAPATRVLVISGPNTGGKTVLLKTIGILSLMLRAGMAIPAHPDSELGLFPEVYAEIGDEQNLSQDLSSYSAHLLDLIAFLEYAGNSALILVDEIFGSTDPDEGCALASSVLREFKNRDCITLATTHLSRLKAFAENEPGFINASFEFDPEHLTPTYHLRLGLPGPSYGIATAKKLGLKPEMIEIAEQMLEPESRRIIELVSQLDQKQTELDQRLRKLGQEEDEAISRAKEIDEKSRRLLEKEKELKREFRKSLESELRAAKVKLNRILEEAKAGGTREKIAGAEKEWSLVREELEEKYPAEDQGEEIKGEDWRIGDVAWVKKLRASAEVIGLDPALGEAALAIGSIRLNENFSGLRRIKAGKDLTARPESRVESETQPIALLAPSPSNTLDLRGMRAEEAEIEMINYLDRSAREGRPAVYIIHGHGTGVLKKLVREYLASSSYVKSFRPGEQNEGGDGITLAFLEKMRAD